MDTPRGWATASTSPSHTLDSLWDVLVLLHVLLGVLGGTSGVETGEVAHASFLGQGFWMGRQGSGPMSKVSPTQEELIEKFPLPGRARVCDLSCPHSNPERWAHL